MALEIFERIANISIDTNSANKTEMSKIYHILRNCLLTYIPSNLIKGRRGVSLLDNKIHLSKRKSSERDYDLKVSPVSTLFPIN